MKNLILKYKWLTRLVLFFHKTLVLKKKNITIGSGVFYSLSTKFEGFNTVSANSDLTNCKLGLATYIANDCVLKHVKFGRFCSIGPFIKTIFGNHPTRHFVSTHPAFFSPLKQAGFTFTKEELFEEFAPKIAENSPYSIEVGNDVWIGANVTLLDGICVGDGAIIASGSLVNKDVPAYAIVGGVPAKIIRMRFGAEEIEFLNQLEWWNRPMNWIKTHAHLFSDVQELKNVVLENEG